ncbi:ADP-ribosylglycohydrolase family protein [Actinoallomurus sp. NPDC052308]|uniref:ADP-ribosylglycohydrolase family protein n=1 Tax=Actinoallomurus sp. NPDC052308 TaxID=3155530 RepID=UPI003419E77D
MYARSEFPEPDRILGCLLGGAIGDALGAPIERATLTEIHARHGEDGLTGYDGPAGGEGIVTGDTQLALLTAEALIQASVRARTRGIGGATGGLLQWNYLRWLESKDGRAAGPEPLEAGGLVPLRGSGLSALPEMRARRGPGRSCVSALRKAAERGEPGHPLGTVETPINDSKGCGGVLRAAPAGLAFSSHAAFGTGCEVAALTHGHPSGYLPAGVLAATVWSLLRGADLPSALATARTALETHRGHDETSRALDAATALAEAGPPSPEGLETLGRGRVGTQALAIAVCAALPATEPGSVRPALLSAINHSGDSDATGALCGYLLGALHGTLGLPGHWQSGLDLRRVVIQIAADAALEFGPNPPTEPGWYGAPMSWLLCYPEA